MGGQGTSLRPMHECIRIVSLAEPQSFVLEAVSMCYTRLNWVEGALNTFQILHSADEETRQNNLFQFPPLVSRTSDPGHCSL